MIRWAAALLILASGALQAEELPARYSVSGVATSDVLNIRAEPNAGSSIIGTLAPDATGVEVTAIADGWASVNAGETAGYVALRFLEREAGADWTRLDGPLTCLGTEPFWSIDYDPVAGEVRYATPETETPQVSSTDLIWPGSPWARTAAIALPVGLAVLRPAQCSDGMSDRGYGIAVDVFLQGGSQMRLSGCCVLGQR